MPATISGRVFNDLNHNGQFDTGEPGISGAFVVLYSTAGGCVAATTNSSGIYSFSITTAGTYTIYEPVADPGSACPPTNFTQPSGFTVSNGPRKLYVTVTAAQISSGATIANNNFSHDTSSNTIPCDTTLNQFARDASTTGSVTGWFVINIVTGASALKTYLTPRDVVNAVGYNEQDGFIYGIDYTQSNSLIRIDNTGVITTLNNPSGLPNSGYNVGAFDGNGFFYVYQSSIARFYVIDLRPNSSTYMLLVDPVSFAEQTSNYGAALTPVAPISDWGYNINDDCLYNADATGTVVRVNPRTGVTTFLTTTGGIAGGYGGCAMDANGNLFSLDNNTGNVLRYIISGDTATGALFSNTISTTGNDAAMCVFATINVDFGDAPDTGPGNGPGNYTTLLANNGPRHGVVNELTLGTQITAEDDAYQNADATGDDLIKGIQDDGLTLPLVMLKPGDTSYTLSVKAVNNTGNTANLYGWLDYNQNGVFSGNESAVTTVPSQAGLQTVTLTFTRPVGITPGPGHTFVRLRLTTQALVNANGNSPALEDTRSIGPAFDGEVEDYILAVNNTADIAVVKTGPASVTAGTQLTYGMTITNNGPDTALGVTLTDAVPAALQSAQYSADGGITWNTWGGSLAIGNLVLNATTTVLIRGTVSSAATGSITNTATIDSISYDPDLSNNTSSLTTTVNSLADMAVTKTASPSPATAGQQLTYTIVARNLGPSDATGVLLTDTPPPNLLNPEFSTDGGATWSAWPNAYSLGTMVNGASRTILLRGTLSASLLGPLSNTVTVSSNTPDPDITNNTATATVDVDASADMSIVKTASPASVNPGRILTYTLNTANAGPSVAQNVVVTDTVSTSLTGVQYSLDNGTTWNTWNGSYTIGTMAVGAMNSIQIRGTVVGSASGTIGNTATVASTTPDPDLSNNTSATSTQVALLADLSVTKTASPEPAVVGQTLTYTVTAHNAGPSTAVNVVIADALAGTLSGPQYSADGGATWVSWPGSYSVASLASGSNVSILIRATVALSATGGISNTATVTSDTPDPDPTNNTITITTPVERPADVYITKSAGASVAGGTLTYTLTVGNNGPVAAVNTVVTDAIPASLSNPQYSLDGGTTWLSWAGSLTLGTLPVGSPVTVLIRGGISPSFQGSITNTATVRSDNPDPDPSNNTDTDITTPVQSADVSIHKEVNNTGVVNPGSTLTYTLTVVNAGPSDSVNVVVTDPLPATLSGPQYSTDGGVTWLSWPGSYAIGTMIPDAPRVILVRGVVIASAAGEIVNTATAFGDTPDPDLSNNTSTTTTPLGQLADLSITKVASPAPATVGQTLTYTLTAHNAGPSTAVGVAFSDFLPAGLNNPQYSTDGGSTWQAWPNILTIGNLSAGANFTLLIRATVDLAVVGSLENTAVVSSDTPDPDPTNNTVTIDTDVSRPADVYITKSAGASVAGGTLTYTLTVGNNGPVAAENTVVTDAIPASLSSPQYSLDGGATWLAWAGSLTIGTLPVGSPVTLLIRGGISAAFQGSITNTATVKSDNPDPDPSNNTDTNTTTPDQSADVSMVKTVNNTGTINPGDTLVYTLTASNAGPSNAQGVVITDPLPAALQSPQYSLNSGTTWLTWSGSHTIGTMAPGAVTTLLVRGVVAASASGNAVNTATARGDTPDPDPDNNTSTTDTPLGQLADLSMVKTASSNPVTVGQVLTYTIAATNAGPSVARNVLITDTLPAGLSNPQYSTDGGINWLPWPGGYSVPTLASGAVLTVLIRGTVTPSAAGSVSNTATVTSDTPDPDPDNNTSTIVIDAHNAVTLTPAKAVDKAYADVGDTLTYTFTLTVAGTTSADHAVLTDLLPAELQYLPGSLLLDGAPVAGTPANASLGTLSVGSHTLVFRASVLSVPAVNPIANRGSFAYDYLQTPSGTPVPVAVDSNIVTTRVNTASLTAQKAVDRAFAKLGDTIIYTVTVNNAGNVAAQDIVLTDLVPDGGTFVPGSVTVGGVAQPAANPNNGVQISDIAGGSTAIITFQVRIDHVPAQNPMVNSAEIQYDYKVDPNGAPVPPKTIETDEVTTQINNAALGAVKTADRQYAAVGDIVTYTVTLTNVGSVPSDSVVFRDILADGLSYVAGSLRVNGVPVSGNIATGVPLGSVQTSAVVQFQVRVDAVPATNPIPNTADASYTFIVDPTQPPVAATAVTNEVLVQVNNATAAIVKSVDKAYGTCGDTLVYTSRITVSGSVAANNVMFQDLVPLGAQYVPGSFTVNGVPVPVADPSVPVNIGTILPGGTAAVVFAVRVACQ